MSRRGKDIQTWAVQCVVDLFLPGEAAAADDIDAIHGAGTGNEDVDDEGNEEAEPTQVTDADCRAFCDLLRGLGPSLLDPV